MLTVYCPKCQSSQVVTRHDARKVMGTVGAVAGTVGGVASTVRGAQVGMQVSAIAGPAAQFIGGLCGAVIGGFVGGAAGCQTGALVGDYVDQNLLDNQQCLSCGYQFSLTQSSQADLSPLFRADPQTGQRPAQRSEDSAAAEYDDE